MHDQGEAFRHAVAQRGDMMYTEGSVLYTRASDVRRERVLRMG